MTSARAYPDPDLLNQSLSVCMAEILSDQEIVDIKNAFSEVDADRDGIIAASQLRAVLKLLGENPTDADLQVPLTG